MTQPVLRKYDRGLSLSAFQHDKNIGVTLQRSYMNKKTNEWVRETVNMFEDDLLKVANLCTSFYNELIELRNKQTPEQKAAPVEEVHDEVPF